MEFDEAVKSVRQQDEATYVDLVEGHNDIVTTSDYSEDETVAAEIDKDIVETTAKRLRIQVLQTNPSDEATTAVQLLARHRQGKRKTCWRRTQKRDSCWLAVCEFK